jgi:hypothetical protein
MEDNLKKNGRRPKKKEEDLKNNAREPEKYGRLLSKNRRQHNKKVEGDLNFLFEKLE